MKPQTFKTLVYKEPEEANMPFGHVSLMERYVMSGSVPQILQHKNTIESMQIVFPHVDFSGVNLIELTINYDVKPLKINPHKHTILNETV
jgi:hypothetical protein